MDYRDFANTLRDLPEIAEMQGENCAGAVLEEHLGELKAYQAQLTVEQRTKEIDAFRRAYHPLLLQSEFGYYTFIKPRGYPGDYVTQEMIWLGRTIKGKHRYSGVTELGRLLTSITFDMAAPKANETRINRIKAVLNNSRDKRVASIGCGSCIEFWDQDEIQLESLFLLDHDVGALSRAKEKLPAGNGRCTFCHENIIKCILRNRHNQCINEQDMVYSLGLLDYFPWRTARKIIEALWVIVASGGRLILTNAHPDNPTRLWMEWVSDWYLDYKDESEFRSLIEPLDQVANAEYEQDEFGVYQYLTLVKEGKS